jgi:hypothetical protein
MRSSFFEFCGDHDPLHFVAKAKSGEGVDRMMMHLLILSLRSRS